MRNKDVTFQLDTDAASALIQDMIMPTIQTSTNAVQARAQAMANSISTNAPTVNAKTAVGTIRRGKRAIGTISVDYTNAREKYIAITALKKAKDAGRVN